MSEIAEPPRRPDPGGTTDRLEMLEQQVRQLTSRLAGWVEAQLVQALEDRRNDMKALRSELQVVVNEQLAGMRAESTSMLSVVTRRLDVAQESLGERLEAVAERAAEAAMTAKELSGDTSKEAEHLAALEQRFGQRLAQLHAQLESRLAASSERQVAELETLRAEVAAGLGGLAELPVASDAMEQRVRSAMSRLSDSVEGRLAEVTEIRKSDLDGLRTELHAALEERAAQIASKSATTIAVVQDRLTGVSTSLGDRLDEVSRQAVSAAEGVAAINAETDAGTARIDAFEHRVKSAMGRLTDSVETRLAESSTGGKSELEALRTELSERLDGVVQDAGRAADVLVALQSSVQSATDRTETLEQQVKSAMGRLTDALDARLAEVGAARQAELVPLRDELRTALAQQAGELRSELGGAVSSVGARMAKAQERLEALEQRDEQAGDRLGALIEAKLTEVVERRAAELEGIRSELQEVLAKQLSDARTEIGTAVDNAHRRFLLSVEQLDLRMNAVAEQATSSFAHVGILQDAVTSDGSRIEALELHTRRTDARLTDLVDAKLSEVAGQRAAEVEELRARLDALATGLDDARTELTGQQVAEVDELRAQLRAALDAHLAETRTDVASALAGARTELAAGAVQIDQRQAALDRRAEDAVASLDALGASVQAALAEAEARLGDQVHARLAELEPLAAEVGEARTEIAATVASLNRRYARAQDQVKKNVASIAEHVDEVAAAAAKARAADAGAMAPLRSDLRLLQAKVAELADAVAELRPRRRTPAPSPARTAPRPASAPRAPAPPKVAPSKAKTAKIAPSEAAKTVKAARVVKPSKAAKAATPVRGRQKTQ